MRVTECTSLVTAVLFLTLQFSSAVPCIPFKHPNHLLVSTKRINVSLKKKFRKHERNYNEVRKSILPQTGSKSSFLVSTLRNFAILYQPPSLTSFGFGMTCGLGYYLLHPSNVEAKVGIRDFHQDRTDLPFHVVVGRVVSFWKKVAPILVHYKFATMWMNRVKCYDRDQRDEIYESLHQRYAPEAQNIVYELKGLFIKIGQVMSSRPDFMPSVYIDHFSELQDNVPPYPSYEIRSVLSESLLKHHGLSFDEVFETFADEPLGSASIGQVHAATLTDNFIKLNDGYSSGKEVAVKVMHIDAEDRFRNDFKILKWLCRVALPGWSPILPELERQFMTEFDYRNEAASLHSVRENMLSSPYKNQVCVPEPLKKFSTQNVLIMEKLEGDKLVSVAESKLTEALRGDKTLAKTLMEERRKAIMSGDADGSTTKEEIQMVQRSIAHHSRFTRISIMWQLASLLWTQRKNIELLLDVHGYQIFINGQFNGDPHPGNILVLPNGRLGLIDYGQCYKMKEDDRLALSSVVKELGANEINDQKVTSAMRNLGFKFKYYTPDVVKEMAKLLFDSDTARIKLGFPTPQELFMHLNSKDLMEFVPDPAVFVCRTSFLFRGMGTMIGMNIHTAPRWRSHAIAALEKG